MIHLDSRLRKLLAGIKIISKGLAFDWQGRGVVVKTADLSDRAKAYIEIEIDGP